MIDTASFAAQRPARDRSCSRLDLGQARSCRASVWERPIQMDRVDPTLSSTVVIDDHTWKPESASALRTECAHLVAHASRAAGPEPTVLYRGHRDSTWTLDSTFARWAIGRFDTSARETFFELSRLFLNHFGAVYGPSEELRRAAAEHHGIDEWFELMKRIQQHNEDHEFEGVGAVGTNLMDWSMDIDVALTFASLEPSIEGALYLFDAQAAGAILIQEPYRNILDRWALAVDAGEMHGYPLLFCPRRQLADERANRQSARYLAQIDLRCPVDVIWAERERNEPRRGRIWQRLLIDPAVKNAIASELAVKGFDLAMMMA